MPKRSRGDLLIHLYNSHLDSASFELADFHKKDFDFQTLKDDELDGSDGGWWCFEISKLETIKFNIERMIEIEKQLYLLVYDGSEEKDRQSED